MVTARNIFFPVFNECLLFSIDRFSYISHRQKMSNSISKYISPFEAFPIGSRWLYNNNLGIYIVVEHVKGEKNTYTEEMIKFKHETNGIVYLVAPGLLVFKPEWTRL